MVGAAAGRSEEMGLAEERQRARKHVFAVNGASDFLEAIRVLFESESYNVTTTNFVAETFDQIAAAKPDVLIIDLAFRLRAGWDLLERLHADDRTSGIPVVVVSTTRSYLEEAQERTSTFGGQRFIAKPFDIDDMLLAIDGLIGKA